MLHCYCYIKHKTRTASQPTNQTGPACARCAVHVRAAERKGLGQGIGRRNPWLPACVFLFQSRCSWPDWCRSLLPGPRIDSQDRPLSIARSGQKDDKEQE